MSMRAQEREPAGRFTITDRAVFAIACASLLAGILVLVVAHGTIAAVIGSCLIGLCGVAFVSLAFLLVGESEDRRYGRRS